MAVHLHQGFDWHQTISTWHRENVRGSKRLFIEELINAPISTGEIVVDYLTSGSFQSWQPAKLAQNNDELTFIATSRTAAPNKYSILVRKAMLCFSYSQPCVEHSMPSDKHGGRSTKAVFMTADGER